MTPQKDLWPQKTCYTERNRDRFTYSTGIHSCLLFRYLYWNDQGTRKIERSRLDGSGRETIIDGLVYWPNQMVIANK